MLYQFQCQKEGSLFYYQHGFNPLPSHTVEVYPVCKSSRFFDLCRTGLAASGGPGRGLSRNMIGCQRSSFVLCSIAIALTGRVYPNLNEAAPMPGRSKTLYLTRDEIERITDYIDENNEALRKYLLDWSNHPEYANGLEVIIAPSWVDEVDDACEQLHL